MAIDKAVDSGVLDTALTYTAERIRAKTGSADQIAWDAAKGFGDAVDGIQAGSGSPATSVDIPVAEYASYDNMTAFINAYSDVISIQNSWVVQFLNNTNTTRAGIIAANVVVGNGVRAGVVSRVGQNGDFIYGVDVYPGATIRVTTFDIPNVGSVERLTFTPTENTQSVEVPFNKTFDSFYVVAYCSDITGSGDVSRIKQFAGRKLPFSGAYTGRIDVINDDGTADYWSQTRTTMTGTTIKFETSRPCYFEAGKTYNAEIFEVTV